MRVLYGASRMALRRRVLDEARDLTAAWPDRRALLIVPEQTKVDMERDFLSATGQGGLMMAEVLSFRRLAWRLLGEVGRQPRQTIDTVGQGMLIHRVLTGSRDNLHAFGHLADRPGFIRQAAAALGDLKRYRIGGTQLREAATAVEDKALSDKAGDLAVLLEGYDAALAANGLCDAEDDLGLLGDVLRELCGRPAASWPWPLDRLSWLSRSAVWISGFGELRDFTPQEDVIIECLNQLCPALTLTVAADHLPFDRQAADIGADCLLPGRRTAWRLLQSYPGCRTERVPDDLNGRAADIAGSFRDNQPLRPASPGQEGWLRLIRADGVDEELAFVAGEIRRLVQEENCRYRDITLAVCGLPSYAPRLRAVCREYGIPLFLDTGHALGGTPLMRFVLSLLDLGLHNWPLSAIMSCLRSGLTPLSVDQIDRLENEMLARGISRPDRLFDDRRYGDDDLLASRDAAFLPWREALDTLRQAAEGAAKCRVLNDFLVRYGMPERIGRRTAELAAAGEMDAAVAQTQAWNELLRVLQQMARLAGSQTMPLQTFRDLLAAGLDAAEAGVIPSALDQVTVGDLKRAMLRQPRVLFLIGATADALPPHLPPEGLLKDQDRLALSGLLGRQLPSSQRDQAFADAFVIYTLLTLPTGRLCLTAPSEAVSSWYSWLAAAGTPVETLPADRSDWDDVRLNAIGPAFRAWLNRQAEGGAASEGWLAVGQTLQDAGLPLAEATSWLRLAAEPSQARLVRIAPDLVRALYDGSPAMSVSQLEKYASCPYLHLATYLLSLQERPVWSPEAGEAGTLLHGVIELALSRLRLELDQMDPADLAGRQAVLARWLAEGPGRLVPELMLAAAEREGLLMFFDRGIRASAGRRVGRLATASLDAILRQYQKEDYRPAWLEWQFGPAQDNSLSLQLSNGISVAFRGKIDRIDLRDGPDGTGFRIVDYKSGDKKADFDALFHGLALQLPAYLEAFARCNPDLLAEDAAYFHMARPILSWPAGTRPDPGQIRASLDKSHLLRGLKLSPPEIGLLRRHALRRSAELADALLAGCFDVEPRKLPGKPAACVYCVMQAVCAFDGRPAGCRWLASLPGRKREVLLQRLSDLEAEKGGAGDAANT